MLKISQVTLKFEFKLHDAH